MGMDTRACSLAILLLGSGCTTRQVVAGAGLGVTAIGAAVLSADYARDQDNQSALTQRLGVTLLVGGVITMFVAAALDEHKDTPEVVIYREPPAPRVDPERNRAAWELTKVAQKSARHDDCERVKTVDPQVKDLDPDLHALVFMRDVAIQRCLVTIMPPPESPAPAP